MTLPPVPTGESSDDNWYQQQGTQYFSLVGDNDVKVSEECYEEVLAKIQELEQTAEAIKERNRLKESISEQKQHEEHLLSCFPAACDQAEEVCEIEIPIEPQELLRSGHVYVTQMIEQTKEINFRQLTTQDKKLVEEAMARELSEVLQSKALRKVQENVPPEVLQQRSIPMRWLLTWKGLDSYTDPGQEKSPGILRSDGLAKAKARLVLIGYKHPDLGKRDFRTGQSLLPTSAPTLSRLGRNLLLQSCAMDKHVLESADAKSAFLKSQQGTGTKSKLYTYVVDEIAQAYNIPKGTAMEVVGAIYGLTTAPRVFWLDADNRLQLLGGECHGVDRCIWIFRNSKGRVCGRVGSHVDDFLIMGNHEDPEWLEIRGKIQNMYRWSPWQRGHFTFAGVQLQQLQNFDISLHQEPFCNDLRPIVIENERNRAKDDKLTPKELSQARGLVMRAQWRAIQSAPQYFARIGLCASSLARATLDVLKEANAITKELKKTSKEGLIFHSFASENLTWRQVIFLHFADAAQRNRYDGSDTGGYVTGIASPKILSGREAPMSIVDYRSWKLDRPTKGSNGSETQALYEGEDKGWKCRLFWALLHGKVLRRGNADDLTSMVESLLITDSRGCYDALSNSDSVLLGMSNAKSGVELKAVQKGTRPGTNCYVTWVPSDLNLVDCVTKVSYESFKVYALWSSRRSWVVRFNEEFVSARKQQKLRVSLGKNKTSAYGSSRDWGSSYGLASKRAWTRTKEWLKVVSMLPKVLQNSIHPLILPDDSRARACSQENTGIASDCDL